MVEVEGYSVDCRGLLWRSQGLWLLNQHVIDSLASCQQMEAVRNVLVRIVSIRLTSNM